MFPGKPTVQRVLGALVAGLAVAMAGCATTERIDAAGDVHALLISIRDDDHAAFDDHVDRGALTGELRDRILDQTDKQGQSDIVRGLGAVLAGPLSKLAVQAMVRPKVFLAVADYYGYRASTPIPPQLEIAAALKALPDGRVCAVAHKRGPCVLTFAYEDGTWRLVSFDGDLSLLSRS
jgi:hypothetical protein